MSGETRAGVVGVGALGQHHARVYAELPGVRFVGAYDRLPERAVEVASRHGGRGFADLESLLAEVDVVSVAVPTVDHHAVAGRALESAHVLVEKPIAASLAEADDLIARAARLGRLLQVGHIERFNPALDILKANVSVPRFVEVHRLSSFSPRSLDIDVVLDLMIHDLDVVLSLDGSDLAQVDAVGVPVLTPKVDIANARLRFSSGLVANLTASRVSAEKTRKFRVFAPRTYISLDFAAREGQIYRLVGGANQAPDIRVERSAAPEEEPLKRQLASFVEAARTGGRPLVSGEDGRRALALAQRILEAISNHNRQIGQDLNHEGSW